MLDDIYKENIIGQDKSIVESNITLGIDCSGLAKTQSKFIYFLNFIFQRSKKPWVRKRLNKLGPRMKKLERREMRCVIRSLQSSLSSREISSLRQLGRLWSVLLRRRGSSSLVRLTIERMRSSGCLDLQRMLQSPLRFSLIMRRIKHWQEFSCSSSTPAKNRLWVAPQLPITTKHLPKTCFVFSPTEWRTGPRTVALRCKFQKPTWRRVLSNLCLS